MASIMPPMFTGIIERLGKVLSVRERAGGRELALAPQEIAGLPPWQSAVIGESISVNGVCLTVSRMAKGGRELGFDAVAETISQSTLGRLRTGDLVNLERSLALGERLGGHFVTGHVDGTGTVLEKKAEGSQILWRIGAPEGLLSLMIAKGSVAVDGISLTVIDVDRSGGWFSFAAIPHTVSVTTLGLRGPRDPVNLETDALGKWVLHGLREILGHPPTLPGR